MARKAAYQKLGADYEGDFMALMSWDTYLAEAKKIRRAGIERAGIFGASCPACYKQVQPSDAGEQPKGAVWCKCKGRDREFTVRDVMAAHGFNPEHGTTMTHARAL